MAFLSHQANLTTWLHFNLNDQNNEKISMHVSSDDSFHSKDSIQQQLSYLTNSLP